MIRTAVGSHPSHFASPPHTPAIIRSFLLRINCPFGIAKLLHGNPLPLPEGGVRVLDCAVQFLFAAPVPILYCSRQTGCMKVPDPAEVAIIEGRRPPRT